MKLSRFYLVISGISIIVALYFFASNKLDYMYIALLSFVLFILLFFKQLSVEKNPFKSKINKIIKTYDSILVEINSLPKLSDKKVITTKFFKDIINVQFEVRKPIYYLKDEEYCDFIIINKEDAYIYTLKDKEDIKSVVEQYIDERNAKEKAKDDEFNFINSLNEPTIVKFDDDTGYKISPVKSDVEKQANNNENNFLENENTNNNSYVEQNSSDLSEEDLDKRIEEIRKQLEKINLISKDIQNK